MLDSVKKISLSERVSKSNILDIVVRELDPPTDDIVNVTVTFSDYTTTQYEAYAVRISLAEFLSNDTEIKKAAQLTKGCFTFCDVNADLGDLTQAHVFSTYAQKVSKYRQQSLGSRGGETRMQGIREHYETLRGTVEEILLKEPDINDNQFAKRLNDAGKTTQSGKKWFAASIPALKEYLNSGTEQGSNSMVR